MNYSLRNAFLLFVDVTLGFFIVCVFPFAWILVVAFAANDVGIHRSLKLPLSVDLSVDCDSTALDIRAATAGTLFVMAP